MSQIVPGALLGLAAGCGATLVVLRLPALRRPTLADRVTPYLRDSAPSSRLMVEATTVTPFPTLERVVRPVVAAAARRLDAAIGGTSSVRRRLDRLAGGRSVEQFRMEQVAWGAGGLALALVVALLLAARSGGINPLATLLMACCGMLGGVLLRDRRLSRDVAERERRMAAEFPTVAEMLALAVAAGEGAVGALERVSAVGHGELVHELRRALADARAGASLVDALDAMSDRTGVAAIRRFVDGVVLAVERGTPLSDVLRAQATDAMESGRRALIEAGGRKEIAMMVPVVFLVLPLSVLFALFPGFYGLTLSVP